VRGFALFNPDVREFIRPKALAIGEILPTSSLTLLQVRQLRSREPKRDRARLPSFAVDESACVKRLDHLAHHRRRHAEESLKVCLGRWRAVNLGVVVDEGEVLPLLGSEQLATIDVAPGPTSSRCSGLIRFGRTVWTCPFAVSYSSSLERERRTASVPFSSVRPFTRPNSAVLFVTSRSPRVRA